MVNKIAKKANDTTVKTTPTSTKDVKSFNDVDRLFDQFLTNGWLNPFSWHMPEIERWKINDGVRIPTVDVIENDNDIVLRAEIPGVEKDDIDVTLSDSTITIQGKNRKEEKEDKENYHRSEISTSSFSRTVTLPTTVDSKDTKATFTNGMLEVTMPKVKDETRKSVKVE